jgi:hypothetical protein
VYVESPHKLSWVEDDILQADKLCGHAWLNTAENTYQQGK